MELGWVKFYRSRYTEVPYLDVKKIPNVVSISKSEMIGMKLLHFCMKNVTYKWTLPKITLFENKIHHQKNLIWTKTTPVFYIGFGATFTQIDGGSLKDQSVSNDKSNHLLTEYIY